MKNLILSILFLILFQTSFSQLVQFAESQNLTQSSGNLFGASLSLNGNNLLIGSYGENNYRGAAYLYVNNGGTYSFVYKFDNTKATNSFENFGISVAMDGNTVVIGANGVNSETGNVHVYSGSGSSWTSQILTAVNGSVGDQFGYAVAVSGNNIAIGAYGKNSDFGAVYIFGLIGGTWTLITEIDSPYPINAQFGYSVALLSTTLLVGAPVTTIGSGFVQVYSYSGSKWSPLTNFYDNSLNGTYCGNSVSFDGSTVAVGCPRDSPNNNIHIGSVYLYTLTGGTPVKLYPFSASTNTLSGQSVSISGNVLAVGSFLDHAYIFAKSGSSWEQTQTLSSPSSSSTYFGSSLVLNGSTLIIGDYGNNGVVGSAYVLSEYLVYTGSQTTGILTGSSGSQTGSAQTGSAQTTGSSGSGAQTTSASVGFGIKLHEVPSLLLFFFLFLFLLN